MSSTATTERPVAAKLVASRADAVKHLQSAIERGIAIRTLRIRNGDELDKARGHKLEWVAQVTELLGSLFDNTSVADYVNDWVGKVFPEYAEFGNFVDQFSDEMDYRLSKLRAVLKRVETAGEGAATPQATPAPSPAPQETTSTAGGSRAASESGKTTEMPMSTMQPSGHKVLFVSHGPKDPSTEAVLQFVQQLSLAVIEADHTNGLIETLEGRNDAGFVVVMNAADHVDGIGKASISESSMFKLGYCAGKLGLRRMCMMHGPAHQPVGESHGIPHVPVDTNGGWQLHLARQMKRAGVDVDLNRLV
jgi:hypothetical protein